MTHNTPRGRLLTPPLPHDAAVASAPQPIDLAAMDSAARDALIASLPPDAAELLDFLSLWMYEVALYKWEKKAREEREEEQRRQQETATRPQESVTVS